MTVRSLNSKWAGFPHKHSEQHTAGEAQHLSTEHLRPMQNVSKSPKHNQQSPWDEITDCVLNWCYAFFNVFKNFACIYLCARCVPSAYTDQKAAPKPLEQELQTVGSHHMGASNRSRFSARSAKVLLTTDPSLSPALASMILTQNLLSHIEKGVKR